MIKNYIKLFFGFSKQSNYNSDGYCKTFFCRIFLAIGLLLLPLGMTSQTQIGQDLEGEEGAFDFFGYSVSISADGSVVAVGAPESNGNGYLRVFHNISEVWTQVGQNIYGEEYNDSFGYAVSISADGSVVAVGAPENTGNGAGSGHVRVYQNISGTWTQIGQDISGDAPEDWFGESVSLSADGSILAASAPYNDGNGLNSGLVRVYQNSSGTWTQIGQDISGDAPEDWFGESISLSADGFTIACGVPGFNSNGISYPDSGAASIYKYIDGTWTELDRIIEYGGAANMDGNLGLSISMNDDGSIVAIGALNLIHITVLNLVMLEYIKKLMTVIISI